MTSANTADVKAALGVLVLVLEMYERIVKFLADQGYRGALWELIATAFRTEGHKVEREISERTEPVFMLSGRT